LASKTNPELVTHIYNTDLVGLLELVVSAKGIRTIRFVNRDRESGKPPTHPIMERLIEELDGYFQGKTIKFKTSLDPAGGTLFQRRVWEELTMIPYGSIRSYAEIAEAIGNPKAVRAVGTANGKNSIPIVVPCHRVIRSDGGLGGYASGTAIKTKLLELEGAELSCI
jgi:methylated-DNA-[protein]-cysteine S-methyltransferase